ncbi:MAG: class I SAM-dependent methyltransferase [Chloroflexota bacterium]
MDQAVLDVMAELEMRNEREKLRGEDGIDALDPDAAKLMYIIATGTKAKQFVEVGTGVGYSTLWLGAAAKLVGGKVITCESDNAKADEAQANIDKAQLSDYVEIVRGDARETLRGRTEPVDFLFIDAVFGNYETYFDVVYKRLTTGSLVIADNVIEDGYDLDDYITYVRNHPNLDSQTVKIGDGLEITVRLS